MDLNNQKAFRQEGWSVVTATSRAAYIWRILIF